MQDAILAIDQGTTGSTALVFAKDGRVIGRAYAELRQHYPSPGFVEHDADEIWDTSRKVMGQALAAAGVAPAQLKAIGITNQRETTVVWDKKTGAPIHRAIVWQSRQTVDLCDALRRDGHEPMFRARTGLVVDAYFSGTKIRWLLDKVKDAKARAAAGELAFGTIDTWLLYKLTGGAVHATDPTNASRTLIFNIHERRWDPELLDILGIPTALLPEVRPSATHFGETKPQDGLPGGIPICGIAGDQQSALFGQGCFEPGMAKNTYGTGCFLMLNTGTECRISEHGLLTTLCCDAKGQVAYALEGSVFIAGAAVQWLRDELQLIKTAAETEAIAKTVDDTAGVYFVPAFVGLGAPHWDPEARGVIVGLTRGASRAHLVRATLESMAYQTRDVVDAMNLDSGVSLTELRVDGGAASNDLLMQFQADILGVSVERPALVETTAAGAAYLAGLGSGFWRNAEELGALRVSERRFVPRMGALDRQRLYDGWRRAVERTRTRNA